MTTYPASKVNVSSFIGEKCPQTLSTDKQTGKAIPFYILFTIEWLPLLLMLLRCGPPLEFLWYFGRNDVFIESFRFLLTFSSKQRFHSKKWNLQPKKKPPHQITECLMQLHTGFKPIHVRIGDRKCGLIGQRYMMSLLAPFSPTPLDKPSPFSLKTS